MALTLAKTHTFKNIRIAYPCLYRKSKYKGKETKYTASLLFDPATNKVAMETLKTLIQAMINTENKGNELSADRLCFYDGNTKAHLAFKNHWILRASSNKPIKELRPDKRKIEHESESLIYSGCYVNAMVNLWWQGDEGYGKRVNCNFIAVQFCGHGEPIDGSYMPDEVIADGFNTVDVPDNNTDESLPF